MTDRDPGTRLSAIALPLEMLLLLALVLRIAWAALIGVVPVSDSAVYDTLARNLLQYGVYGFTPDAPSAYWAVGTSAIYAGAYKLLGIGPSAVVSVNLLSSLLIVWGIWDLGRRWASEVEARLAALLFALWPMAIQFTTILASELHFIALMLLGLMAWDRAQRLAASSFWLWSLASGTLLAAAVYIRPIALLIPAALALAALLRAPRRNLGVIVKAATVTTVIVICLLPWSARNERIFGEPVLISTNFWPNLWIGNQREAGGEYVDLPPEVENMSETERSDYLKERVLEMLRDDPAGFISLTIAKAIRLHHRETIGVAWNETQIRSLAGSAGVTIAKLVSTGWWYLILALALYGIFDSMRRQGIWDTLLSSPVWLWAYMIGVHAVILIGDRFHMPAMPMIALLAATGVTALPRIGRAGR